MIDCVYLIACLIIRLLLEGSSAEAGALGELVIRDGTSEVQEAFQLFHLAAEQHIPHAEHHLATMYEYGMGIPQDFSLAIHFYQRAAEQKYLESMYNLALMYSYGRGVSQDYKTALPLLEGAAREDHAPSCYYLGIFKMYGYGCEPDYEHAFNWFEKAAALDDFRISGKAKEAAISLRKQVDEANEENERTLTMLQRRSEVGED